MALGFRLGQFDQALPLFKLARRGDLHGGAVPDIHLTTLQLAKLLEFVASSETSKCARKLGHHLGRRPSGSQHHDF